MQPIERIAGHSGFLRARAGRPAVGTEFLSPVDAAWFHMDPVHPADIISVMVLEGELDEGRLRRLLTERLVVRRKFRCRVVGSPGGMAPPYWEEESASSLDAHLRHCHLPEGAGDAELLAVVNEIANTPIDFDRSPWRVWLVDGAPTGSVLVTHIHHCIGDGFWLLTLLLSLADGTPEGPPCTPPLAPPLQHGPTRHRLAKLFGVSRRIERSLSDVVHLLSLPFDPATPLRGSLNGERRLAWSKGIEFSRVKALARQCGVTINDVLLTTLSGALRRYVIEHGDTPQTFRAIVPVNLRPPSATVDEEHGNWFGLVFVDLPIAELDREARLGLVVRTMTRIKGSEEAAVSLALMSVLGRLPAVVQRLTDDVLARKATLVVTNVPGPRRTIYLAGRPIRDMTFWAPHSSGLSCGASILSYAGMIRVGIRSDAAVVPDPELIARHFDAEFGAWETESDERRRVAASCE